MSISVFVVTTEQWQLAESFFTPVAFGQGSGPFRTSANDVWLPLMPQSGSPRPLTMWHSTDNGSTWATEDPTSGPVDPSNSMQAIWWDGTRYLWAAGADPSTSEIQLQKFDAVSKTWGSPFATGGPAVETIHQLLLRSDSNWVVLYADRLSGASSATMWNGSSWSTPSTFDDNSDDGPFDSVAAWIGPTDDIHTLGIIGILGGTEGLAQYQRINADFSLGPYIDLQSAGFIFSGDADHLGTQQFGITLDPTGTKVVIPATTTAFGATSKPCLLVGTPLSGLGSSANWSLGPALDSLGYARYPQAYYDGAGNPAIIYQFENDPVHFEPSAQYIGTGNPTTWQPIAFSPPPHLQFTCLRVTPTEMMGAYGGWDGDGIAFWRFDIPASTTIFNDFE